MAAPRIPCSPRSLPELKNPRATNSYALGMDIVSTLRQQGAEIDTRALAAGVADTLAGKCALTPEQQKAATEAFTRYLQESSAARMKASAARNLQEGHSSPPTPKNRACR